jgi:hypothetical protein
MLQSFGNIRTISRQSFIMLEKFESVNKMGMCQVHIDTDQLLICHG